MLLALALVVLSGLTALTLHRAGKTLEYIERQNQINRELPLLRVLLADLLSAETGQRGYLLTGREIYLAPYQQALQDYDRQIDALSAMHAPGSAEQARLARAEQLIQLKLQELASTITLQRAGQAAAARELVLSDRGKVYMDELRRLIEQMTEELVAERDVLAGNLTTVAIQARMLMVIGSSLLLAFASLALWKLAKSLRRNAELMARLEAEATHDPLTGLYNRRHFDQFLRHKLAVANRIDHPLALLFLDLDGFKSVNDRLGHETGDRLLKAVAQALKATVRESDLLCRLGGDEFVVLTLDGATERERLERLASRLIEAVARVSADPAWASARVGASIGIAAYPQTAGSADALLDAADHAMYVAKSLGKGRAHFAEPASVSPPPRSSRRQAAA